MCLDVSVNTFSNCWRLNEYKHQASNCYQLTKEQKKSNDIRFIYLLHEGLVHAQPCMCWQGIPHFNMPYNLVRSVSLTFPSRLRDYLLYNWLYPRRPWPLGGVSWDLLIFVSHHRQRNVLSHVVQLIGEAVGAGNVDGGAVIMILSDCKDKNISYTPWLYEHGLTKRGKYLNQPSSAVVIKMFK